MKRKDNLQTAAGTPRFRSGERGGAMILALVVVVVLSTLALAMVTFTEHEENTAASYRDQMQVQSLAEAGARIAVQMFRNPNDRRLVPRFSDVAVADPANYDYYGTTPDQVTASLAALGIYRKTRSGGGSQLYAGKDGVFFKGPYDENWATYFGGTYNADPASDRYDLTFRREPPQGVTTPITSSWLDTKVNALLSSGNTYNTNVGRITEISFYAPPATANESYAYATVRVTAEKLDGGRVVAREVVEAIIGTTAATPSILSNGNLVLESNASLCGSECEHIHANGDLTTKSVNISGGEPSATYTGNFIDENNSAIDPKAEKTESVPPPMINPWDVLYRPTTDALLDRYYLITNRIPAAEWTDNDPNTTTPEYDCTSGGGRCQDYGLEYKSDGTIQARGAQSRLYKWNRTLKRWEQVGGAVGDGGTHTLGAATIHYFNSPDQAYSATDFSNPVKVVASSDNSMTPFNKDKVPYVYWKTQGIGIPAVNDPIQNTVILVDGCFEIGSSSGGNRQPGKPAWRTSLITVGGFRLGSSSNIDPALENRVMMIAGRDIWIASSLNNDLQGGGQDYCTAPTYKNPPSTPEHIAASGVIAAHEQIVVGSSSKLLGILIAENRINLDNNRNSKGFAVFDMTGSDIKNSAMFIHSSANHGYLCDEPGWPFPLTGNAEILAMNTAGK